MQGPPPCDGAVGEGGNALLLDTSGDGAVDVTDAIYGLSYLFKSGPAPARGTACVRLEGCPSVCR